MRESSAQLLRYTMKRIHQNEYQNTLTLILHNAFIVQKQRQISNISRTLVGNKIVYHSNVVGAPSIGAAPTKSSFST